MTDDQLARFVAIEKRLRQLEDEQDDLKDERKRLEQSLLEQWAERAQTKATLDGLTVYVRSDFFCSKRAGIATETVCSVLKAEGYHDLVAEAYSAQSLKARVKELLAAGEDQVSDSLRAVLQWDTIPRLVAIKA